MLPDLAVMIGLYIITRMTRLLVRREPKEHSAVAVLAMLTVLAAVLGIADILYRGAGFLQQLEQLQK